MIYSDTELEDKRSEWLEQEGRSAEDVMRDDEGEYVLGNEDENGEHEHTYLPREIQRQ